MVVELIDLADESDEGEDGDSQSDLDVSLTEL